MDYTPLEDGSTAFYDSAGNLTSIVMRDGTVVASDTSIVSDFLRQVSGGFAGAISRALNGDTGGAVRTASAPASAVPSFGLTPQVRNVLLIVVAVLLAKKFFA